MERGPEYNILRHAEAIAARASTPERQKPHVVIMTLDTAHTITAVMIDRKIAMMDQGLCEDNVLEPLTDKLETVTHIYDGQMPGFVQVGITQEEASCIKQGLVESLMQWTDPKLQEDSKRRQASTDVAQREGAAFAEFNRAFAIATNLT